MDASLNYLSYRYRFLGILFFLGGATFHCIDLLGVEKTFAWGAGMVFLGSTILTIIFWIQFLINRKFWTYFFKRCLMWPLLFPHLSAFLLCRECLPEKTLRPLIILPKLLFQWQFSIMSESAVRNCSFHRKEDQRLLASVTVLYC